MGLRINDPLGMTVGFFQQSGDGFGDVHFEFEASNVNLPDGKCPSKGSSTPLFTRWQFYVGDIHKGKHIGVPEEGYIVQKIDIFCVNKYCDGSCCDESLPDRPSFTLFEACFVPEGSTTCYGEKNNPDTFHKEVLPNTCGKFKAVATARFYFKNTHHWNGVKHDGIGDIGGRDKDAPGKDGWSRGAWDLPPECGDVVGSSGGFLWRRTEPRFWRSANPLGDGPEIQRTFSVQYDCCPAGSGITGHYYPNETGSKE